LNSKEEDEKAWLSVSDVLHVGLSSWKQRCGSEPAIFFCNPEDRGFSSTDKPWSLGHHTSCGPQERYFFVTAKHLPRDLCILDGVGIRIVVEIDAGHPPLSD
jgi:hypothetical protein